MGAYTSGKVFGVTVLKSYFVTFIAEKNAIYRWSIKFAIHVPDDYKYYST